MTKITDIKSFIVWEGHRNLFILKVNNISIRLISRRFQLRAIKSSVRALGRSQGVLNAL